MNQCTRVVWRNSKHNLEGNKYWGNWSVQNPCLKGHLHSVFVALIKVVVANTAVKKLYDKGIISDDCVTFVGNHIKLNDKFLIKYNV